MQDWSLGARFLLPNDWYQFNTAVEMIYKALGKKDIRKEINLNGINVDLYFEESSNNINQRVAVECLYRSKKIEQREVEKFKTLLEHLIESNKADIGLIVSNQEFSNEAKLFAQANNIKLEEFDYLKQDLIHKLDVHDNIKIPLLSSLNAGFIAIKTPEILKSTIFVMMPFKKEYDDLYYYGISGCAEKLGLKCIRADEIEHNSDVMPIVCDHIDKSEFLIAEVSEHNPNVYYELGWAHAKGKEPILLLKEGMKIPFDLQSKNHIQYNTIRDCDEKLKRRLGEFLRNKSLFSAKYPHNTTGGLGNPL